jgi:NAD-dependent dihydropyrimidine dehydrogenase PreA subunit
MKQKYLKNVSTLKLDRDKCIGCKMCTYVCPHNVFETVEKKAVIQNPDNCMECGACMKNCASEAINVNAGVGCAYAILLSPDGTCDCSGNKKSCC